MPKPFDDPEAESAFQGWYKKQATKAGIDTNPDNPAHKYNYRAAYAAGVKPVIDPTDKKYHWDSRYKAPDHPNRYVNGIDTITGKRISRSAKSSPKR